MSVRVFGSAGPRQGDRAHLAEDRGEVLEGPLLADPPVVGDPVDVDGVPSDRASGRRDAEQVAGVGRRHDEPQRDQIVARDRVLHGCLDVRQGADEPAEDGDDVVDAGDGSERAAVPGDVGREVVAGSLRVAAGEDVGDILARDGLAPVLW